MIARWALSAALLLALFFLGTPAPLAQSQPSYQHVENLTQTFRPNRDFTAIAAAPSDPDRLYVATSNGWIYSSSDGGKSWNETRLLHAHPSLPTRSTVRYGYTLWPEYILRLPYADAIEWPQEHWAVNQLRVHYLFTPDGFNIEELNPRPYLTDGGPTQLGDLAVRNSFLVAESHFHDVIAGVGGPRHALEMAHGIPLKLKSTVEPLLKVSVHVNWLAVHPTNPDYVLAATDDGVYRSEDGGGGWVREYDHLEESNRNIRHLSFDMADPDTRYMCTDFGTLVSRDGGITYDRVRDPIIGRRQCFFVTARPGHPGEIWVGTNAGTYMSSDGGDKFTRRHIERAPGRQHIKRIVFDPHDDDRIITMANEVVFLSDDGGHTFERKGENAFKAQTINSVVFAPGDRHLMVATNRDVFASHDDGENWQVIMFGNINWKIRRMFFPRGLSGGLWVLTSYELLKLSSREAYELSDAQLRELRAEISDEPTLSEAIFESLRWHGVLRPDLNRKRGKSRLSHIFPFIHAEVSYRHFEVTQFDRLDVIFGPGFNPDGSIPKGLGVSGPYSDLHWNVYASWDLQSLVFDREEMPQGPVFEENERIARSLRETVASLFAERRRLQIQAFARAQSDLRSIALRDLRIQELTYLLNILTHDLFDRYADGERIDAWPE